MLCIIKTEFLKLKRFLILLIGLIGMSFPSILSVFTQMVASPESTIHNFDFSALFSSTIWNSTTIFMPVIYTLIGNYLIHREYTDDTLKNILVIPISFKRLLFGKLLAMGLLSVLFGLYVYAVTLIVGLLSGVKGMSITILITGLLQILGSSVFTYIAIMPVIAVTSRRRQSFMGGVILSFLFGYCAMFIKHVTIRSIYPILSGLTIIRFDMETFMNTSKPGSLTLSVLSLLTMLLLTATIVMLTNPQQIAFNNRKHKLAGIFLRQSQKT